MAENKMDLFLMNRTGNDRLLSRKRQQIVSLMQRFPFVRQCIKCSAKNCQRVDDVFLKAQQAVIYPFVPPLYDLTTGNMTMACKRALTRIFRIFDMDHDGFLSDNELIRFERDTFPLPIFDRELNEWKKHIATHNHSPGETVTVDEKLSVHGFLTMFDVFIGQNRLDLVWQALRKYNYDDDLNLHVPDSISNPDESVISSWRLSRSAKKFLTHLFRQFDSSKTGSLSPDDIVSMFSIVSPPCLPPWHPMRAPDLFKDCFSLPKESPAAPGSSESSEQSEYQVDTSLIVPSAMSQSALSTSGVSLLSSDSLPTIDVGGMHPLSKSLSYLEWMGHWHALSAISPAVTRAELYRLGHLEDRGKISDLSRRRKKKKEVGDIVSDDAIYRDSHLRSREVRVLVLGRRSCGKTSLLNALCGTFDATIESGPQAIDTKFTSRPETSATFIKMKRKLSPMATGEKTLYEEFVVHLVFTDVPESAAAKQSEHINQLSELFGTSLASRDRLCDLAMLVFDQTDEASFEYVKEIESSLLSQGTPRVFVATKGDLVSKAESDVAASAALELALTHCLRFDLEPPLVTSAANSEPRAGGSKRADALAHLSLCALRDESGLDILRSIPHEEQKRKDASRRRNLMWLGGIVSAGVVIAVGVGLLLNTSGKKGHKGSSAFGWLRNFFGPAKNTSRA